MVKTTQVQGQQVKAVVSNVTWNLISETLWPATNCSKYTRVYVYFWKAYIWLCFFLTYVDPRVVVPGGDWSYSSNVIVAITVPLLIIICILLGVMVHMTCLLCLINENPRGMRGNCCYYLLVDTVYVTLALSVFGSGFLMCVYVCPDPYKWCIWCSTIN